MAAARAAYHYADGTIIQVSIEVTESYPDSVDEARSQAVRGVVDLMRDLADSDDE